MGAVIVVGLALLVVHAACKANALSQAASAAQATNLPNPSPVTAGSATSTPSPASSLGAPGMFNGYEIMLDTNTVYPGNGAAMYTITEVYPGTQGIPLPMVPGVASNGFNPNPSSNKTLTTQTKPKVPFAAPLYPATPIFKL